MAQTEVVFKKVCSYAQPQNLVYVKQLLIVREDGKKYLVLRLVNERAERVSAVKVSVVSYDDDGREIGTKTETLQVSGETDKPFVPERKIPLSDNACDCKVSVVAADYGDYRYRADGNNIVVDYNAEKPAEKRAELSKKKIAKAGKNGVAVQRRTLKAPVLVIVGMFVALALALLAVYLHTLYFVEHEKTFLYSGVEYAFENDDKSDGTNIYVVGYNGNRARVVIPEFIEGHRVTHIADGAFRNNDSMTSIGFEADIPVGDFAFENCKALKTVEFEKITELGVGAFKGCVRLTEAVIHDGITVVPREAFSGCTSLETASVLQSDKLIQIGQNAFANCTGLRDVDIARRIDYSYNSGNRSYFTGASVRRLHLVDFDISSEIHGNDRICSLFGKESATSTDDISLGELVIDRLSAIPAGFCQNLSISKFEVKSIDNTFVGESAFGGCSNLREFKLPAGSSVTGVGAYAFYGTALTGFNGITVETLGASAFENCTALTSVSFSGNVVLSELGESAFKGCTSLASVSVPVGVTVIPSQAFMDCAALTDVRYANAAIINEIGDSAFKNCASLANIAFPGNTLTSIWASAFEGCSSLESVALPETLLSALDNAFKDCVSLTELTVPDGVVRMGKGVIAGCNGLTNITLPFIGEMPEVNNYLAFMFGADNRYYTENTFVPSSLSSVTVTSASAIGACAFSLCENITEIDLPETVASIGESAFNGCAALTEFTLPNTVVSVGRGAFGGCSSLAELTVPFVGGEREVNSFLSYMFGASSYYDGSLVPQSLTSVVVTDAASIGVGAFYGCEYLRSITLPETLATVEGGAFYGCSSVTELVVPNSVQSIGAGAFAGMSALGTLSVPFVGAMRANEYTYLYADEAFTLGYLFENGEVPRALKKIAVTDCAFIGARAFYNCIYLEQAELGCEIRGVGTDAFGRCYKLYEVFNFGGTQIEKGSVTDVGGIARYALKVHTDREEAPLEQAEADGFRYVKDDDGNWYLIDCDTSVEQAVLPEYVSAGDHSFGEYALWQYIFYGCAQLKSAEIPANVTAVGDGAFGDCTALTRVSYGQGSRVTRIGDETFYNCYMLYDLDLPEGIAEYGARSFYNCSRIKKITIPVGATESSIGEQAFYNCLRLFEVVNLSGLDISAGDTRYGYVAANARSVSSSPTSGLDSVITDGGVHYMALNNNGIRYWAVDYYGAGELSLTEFRKDGSTVSEFAIYPGAFNSFDCVRNITVGYDTIRNVTISSAVSGVHTEFFGCENIESVSFVEGGASGASVTLGDSAFMSARNSLERVSSAVPLVFNGSNIFPTDKLVTARFDARIENLTSDAFAPSGNDEPVRLSVYLSDVGAIQADAFGGTASLYSVTASGYVGAIKSGAFDGCYNLNTLRFGNVGTVERRAVSNTGVTSIAFGDVTTVSDNAFDGNGNLASATFGDVTSFGSYIFGNDGSSYNGSSLASITAGDVGSIGDYAFYGLQRLASVSLEQADSIGNYAFASNYALTSFGISSPASELAIGIGAFSSTGLTSFAYAGRISRLGDSAFENCSSLRTVNLAAVDRIGSAEYSNGRVFARCILDSITFSGNVGTVGMYAFPFDNSSIKTVAFNGAVGTVEPYAFGGTVERVAFGSSVVTLSDYAFYNWGGQSVTFGGSLSTLGVQAFAYCYNLTEIALPDSLAEIKDNAFIGCGVLHKVTLPSSLRTLSDTAFAECKFVFVVYNRSGLSSAAVAAKFDRPVLVTNDSGRTAISYYDDGASGARFVKVDGRWYLYGLPNASYTTVMLPDSFTASGENVTSYSIRAYASYGVDNSSTYYDLYVPTAVSDIDAAALSGHFNIYYRGTRSQWNRIYGGDNAAAMNIYIYKTCVHSDEEGYWRFGSDNLPTLSCTEWEWTSDQWQVTTPPTCITEGVQTARCPHCNKVLTMSMGYGEHNIVDGECTVCHAREVKLTAANMASLGFCTISNDPRYPFTVSANGEITSTNKTHSSSSSFTVTATKPVTVTFDASVSSESGYDFFQIYVNGNLHDRLSGNVTNSYLFALNAGDTIEFRYSKDGSTSSGTDSVTISNLTFICSEDTEIESASVTVYELRASSPLGHVGGSTLPSEACRLLSVYGAPAHSKQEDQ